MMTVAEQQYYRDVKNISHSLARIADIMGKIETQLEGLTRPTITTDSEINTANILDKFLQ